ncbi:carbohydrate ABC transporter permease [Paenibacillus lemnae]|uniref:Carbohydrate ABC transporter permease n=1 Tax=Paenibacillus lemnae TaxID=1330551 RepID=A0A848MCG3_PAELE|nr:carbohydrate ABC transporter permease [Paenibacillus lemnae]NMO97861.1 carbohydrate ABC transporter permease [Paenibacillus lemnae]
MNMTQFAARSGRFLSVLILLGYGVLVVYPLTWTLISSFKTTEEFYASPFALPQSLNFDNYVQAFERAQIGDYFINSIFVTVLSLAVCNILGFAAAYVITRYRFTFLQVLKRFYIGALFFPVAFSIVPLFMLLNRIHLLDSLVGLSLVYAVSAIPFTIYLLTGFLASIPKDYEESAKIDGCSLFGILFRIIAPMAKPGIITITIFNVMNFWNEYIYALSFITTESKRTLTLGLAYLMEVQRYATDWGALFAGLVVVMVPTLIVYALLQNRITAGLNMGGLKG